MNIATLSLATLLAAQTPTPSVSPPTEQEQLQAQYDRALAAGYKALFLCSAIANAERNGTIRTPESVLQWELSGIQAPLDEIVSELPYSIERSATSGAVESVSVVYGESAARIALHTPERGCAIQPIGFSLPEKREAPTPPVDITFSREVDPMMLNLADKRVDVGAAFTGKYGEGRTTVVTVLYKGKHAGEQFGDGFFAKTPQRTWSVAKSIAAVLVGAAVYRGEADVNASAGLGADESDPRRAITIDQALRMASGRYSATRGNRTDALYFGGATVAESMTHWPLIQTPGTVYRYANYDTLAATQAIKHTFAEHPPAEFFAKVGMHNTVAETDWQGDYILSSQVWSTSRDLARLGQLMLDDGVLPSGERVLPEGWLEYVSTPSGPQPDSPFGYGAGWWLMNKSDGVPPDTIAAFGNRGQYIVVVPSREVVIVRRGENKVGTRFDIAAFTRDVLAALEE
ncbi:serine hydrolase domain-containing protein [Altererythrobacter lutimaris]|uniref:Serine hydrolase n=1 Tax=Altererythrobacter lutimaris TaxID=2743979 RepID=A0A850HAX5_9SPHN|nr:serine hydrolase [Altererythrobacter lutimaris]NVE94131.1 serine hydrolase [Altererythrobacter lutimaris]